MDIPTDDSADEYLKVLTPEQHAAVLSESRKLFVSAGPGSGKTRVLTTRIFHRLLRPLIAKHVASDKTSRSAFGKFPHILVITFTNKAAQELKERLGGLSASAIAASQAPDLSPVHTERIKKLILQRQLYIGTFHSLCFRLLIRFAPSYMDVGQFSILDTSGSKQLISLVTEKIKREAGKGRFSFPEATLKHFRVKLFLTIVGEHKQRYRRPGHLDFPTKNPWALYSVEHFSAIAADKVYLPGTGEEDKRNVIQMYTEAYQQYTSMMRTAKQLDFDDLLQWTIHLLRRMPANDNCDERRALNLMVSELYVDEFQDTNCLQLEFLSTLQQFCSQTAAQPLSITLVGDPDQTIFSWRNFTPTEAAPPTSDGTSLFGTHPGPTAEYGWDIQLLTANFRSPRNIIRAASTIITFDSSRAKRTAASDLQHSGTEAGGPHIVLRGLYCISSEHEAIADEILRLKASAERMGAPFQFRDVAILMRAASASKALMQKLASARIPSTGLGGSGLWDSKVARDLLAYVRLLRNPSDLTSLLRAVNVPPRKLGSVSLQRIGALVASSGLPALDALLQLINGPRPRSTATESKLRSHAGLVDFASVIKKIRTEFAAPECTLGSLLNSILKFTNYEAHLPQPADDDDDEESGPLSQVLTLKQIASKIQTVQVDDEENENPPILNDIDCLLEAAGLGHSADTADSKLATPDAVRISTLHSSKGLEWPFVFIAGARADEIPHPRCRTRESIDEEARLMYVGVTRCQYQLYISWFKDSNLDGRRPNSDHSPFLSKIPHSVFNESLPSLDVSFWTNFSRSVHRDFSVPEGVDLQSSPPRHIPFKKEPNSHQNFNSQPFNPRMSSERGRSPAGHSFLTPGYSGQPDSTSDRNAPKRLKRENISPPHGFVSAASLYSKPQYNPTLSSLSDIRLTSGFVSAASLLKREHASADEPSVVPSTSGTARFRQQPLGSFVSAASLIKKERVSSGYKPSAVPPTSDATQIHSPPSGSFVSAAALCKPTQPKNPKSSSKAALKSEVPEIKITSTKGKEPKKATLHSFFQKACPPSDDSEDSDVIFL